MRRDQWGCPECHASCTEKQEGGYLIVSCTNCLWGVRYKRPEMRSDECSENVNKDVE